MTLTTASATANNTMQYFPVFILAAADAKENFLQEILGNFEKYKTRKRHRLEN